MKTLRERFEDKLKVALRQNDPILLWEETILSFIEQECLRREKKAKERDEEWWLKRMEEATNKAYQRGKQSRSAEILALLQEGGNRLKI